MTHAILKEKVRGLDVGVILIIVGFFALVIGKVGHITDSTLKAAGWIILNWVLRVVGILLILAGIGSML